MRSLALLLAIIGLISGCSPRLRSSIPVPQVIPLASKNEKAIPAPASSQLSIDQFTDGRKQKAFITFNGKVSEPEGDVGAAVQSGLTMAFKKTGYEITDSAPIIIAGEIKKWEAVIETGFSDKVDGQATIKVEVFDPANKKIYTGTYEGFASIEHPSLDEEDIEKALGTAMGQAVHQVTVDNQLANVLKSF
jgi:hypothetical protein